MSRQIYIGKYCHLVDYHYELVSELNSIELQETIDGQNAAKKVAELKEDLERTESKLAGLHEEFDTEDVRFLLNKLLG